ncbi:MAG TPA: pirin family protein [Frankiaceae bacterium]|nr:pirin family protein [Frankiaceae bacterium]
MSGPLDGEATGGDVPEPPVVEVTEARTAVVGAVTVRRALPRRGRRTVGAWCFADHLGPAGVDGPDIGPHPHTGLQTVTWLLEGAALHRDSLGSEQVVRPGQLNLMTAGNGVAHAEESTGDGGGRLHGVQLWVAQPEATRHGGAAFEHHAELPSVEVRGGVATVLVGSLLGAESPARHDTPLLGADLRLDGGISEWPLEAAYEHALLVLDGAVGVDGRGVEPGSLAYLGAGRTELALDAVGPARVLLLGGEPFESSVVMWWNFVGRSRDEVTEAWRSWQAADDRFGRVDSRLQRIPVGPPPWAPAG